MDSEILEYRLDCPWERKEVGPNICRNCERKSTCESVQSMVASSDMEKWKGTILGGGVDVIVNFRKKVFKFIMG